MTDLGNLSVEYVEGLLRQYRRDPKTLPRRWRRYFEDTLTSEEEPARAGLGPSFRPASLFNPPGDAGVGERVLWERFERLRDAFRARGHLAADIDPLGRPRREVPELAPDSWGFTQADLDTPLPPPPGEDGGSATLGERIGRLRAVYCGPVGVEFMHVDDPAVRRWLQERMERSGARPALPDEQERRMFQRLTEATAFEQFVLKRYIGAKTFSLEGAEMLVPLLDLAIEKAGRQGIGEIVIGMAHRGRLNVLANILGKNPRKIFHEFEKVLPAPGEGGDVKYHLGHSNDWTTADGKTVHLTLCFNPSHLESVDPVAVGSLRGKQDRAGDGDRQGGLAILIHGDAAFAGEGIVQETLNLSGLPAYTTGGTLHVVVNNQLGFTTSPEEGRSGTYATEVAKMLPSPIFHVHGEDPQAVAGVLELAMDFRREFRRDVFIDMVCYRRRGHNESDEPEFTQPVMYRRIADRKPVRDLVLDDLLRRDVLTADGAERAADECRRRLEEEYERARAGDVGGPSCELGYVWSGYAEGMEIDDAPVPMSVDRHRLARILEGLTELPDDFQVHPKLKRWLKRRAEMAAGERPLDWSAAEALALGTLAAEGYRVRLSGQDTARGTFSQRHAVLVDVETGRTYAPLEHVDPDQAPVEIFNSPLCEAGALGFEYGYSLSYPDCLVAWEAQFGDFWNAAQVIVDQFLASAEEKWRRLSGIVLLLPHGYEGMGPEHSSARLERFLRLSKRHNLQVVVPTTPAQLFHCLRRQMHRRWLKPLVMMTPKSLLRHKRVVSSLDELAGGRFHRVLPDEGAAPAEQVERVLLCSGKVYYDLIQKREELDRRDVAVVRIEQLYPFPKEQLDAAVGAYPDGTPVLWVQEEPENMGANYYVRVRFGNRYADRYPFDSVARPRAASPATGSASLHEKEQEELLDKAFADGWTRSRAEKKNEQLPI